MCGPVANRSMPISKATSANAPNNLDWDSPNQPNVGRGVSVGLLAAGAHPVSTAFSRMEADGKVVLYVSSTDMGQGARTVFSQIVAEELALTVDDIRVMGGDTQVTPYDRSTGASRSTTLAGMAVLRSGAELREQLLDIASEQLGLPPEAWRCAMALFGMKTRR